MSHRMLPLAIVAFLGLLTSSCQANTFTQTGFHQTRYGYDVLYSDSDNQLVMPENWRIDNYYQQQDKSLTEKTGDAYRREVGFDLDGNGEIDFKETRATYDLRFENVRTAGVIWLRSYPLHADAGQKDLRSLMRDLVGSIAGGSYEFSKVKDKVVGGDIRVAANQISEVAANLAGCEALSSTVDVTNVDQAQIQAKAVIRRIKVVLVRSGILEKVGLESKFPVYFLAAYSEQPEFFAENLPAFDQFLTQIRIANRSGYQETPNKTAEKPAAGASAAPLPTPPADPPAH